MTTVVRIFTVCAVLIATTCFADEKLYRVNSKDVGWDSIDLTISEVRRDGQVSVVSVPHYESRSSVESRFAMCAFTDIAVQRDFEAWVVSDQAAGRDLVRVGFLKSEADDPAKVLGKDFAGETALRGPVSTLNRMCGITRKN